MFSFLEHTKHENALLQIMIEIIMTILGLNCIYLHYLSKTQHKRNVNEPQSTQLSPAPEKLSVRICCIAIRQIFSSLCQFT